MKPKAVPSTTFRTHSLTSKLGSTAITLRAGIKASVIPKRAAAHPALDLTVVGDPCAAGNVSEVELLTGVMERTLKLAAGDSVVGVKDHFLQGSVRFLTRPSSRTRSTGGCRTAQLNPHFPGFPAADRQLRRRGLYFSNTSGLGPRILILCSLSFHLIACLIPVLLSVRKPATNPIDC